jgi:hypothetical protein
MYPGFLFFRFMPNLPSVYHRLPLKSPTISPFSLCLHSVLPLADITNKPIHTLLHTPSIDGTTRNDTPIPVLELPQLERLANLACTFRARLILLVGENEERGVAEFFFVEHGAEFFRGCGEALDVGRVDDEDYGGGVGVVAAPVGADRGLASEVLRVGRVR